MAADQAPDPHRTTYEPAGKSQVRQQFRPTSAPRAARSLAEPARGGAAEGQDGGAAHDRRDRPTSAPLAREGVGGGEFAGGGGVLAHGQAAGSDGDGDSQAHEVGMAAGGYYPYVMRPTSAPSRPPYVLEAGPEQRPGSAGAGRPRLAARSRAGTRLPNSGALRFVEEASGRPPVRVFSPMTSPLTDTTRFQPTWALSKHRQREREMLAESSLQAALSYEGSRLGSAGGTRPGSVISQASTGSAAASRRAAGSAAGPYKDMPRMAIRNPLAQRIGGSTGDLAEVNGSFIPLQSQSKIPHYDALYDPHLKAFWGRQDVKKVLSLEGKTRDHWAPDSGMLEAAISQELTELSRPRDIAEVMAPLDPLISALGVDPPDVLPGVNLASDVMQIEVSEEAVSVAAEFLPLSLKQPVISTWLHWGSQTGATTAPDLDLSAVCFDSKARVLDTIFYRNLVSRHEAIVHLGDDTDDTIAPAELVTNPNTAADDVAAATRRKEGLLIHLPRIQKDVVAIALAVTCYSEEMGLSEAAGAEMRVCVGPTHAAGLDNDLVRYVLSSERYKAAAPCMLVRDNASESGWSIFTRPRVCLANVVVEMIPVLQTMLRQTNVCVPYVLHVEYCTARRPTSSLRGKRSDYINSFKAVALAVRRAFPFVVVQGNPMAPEEQPRVGSFEISFVDAERGTSQLLFSKIQQGKWPARMDTILRSVAEAMASVQVMYQLPDDRSEVEASVVDAVSGLEVPWAVVEVHALGLAAQKLQIVERSATTKSGKRSKSSSSKSASRNADTLAPGKRLYRVQTNGNGVLRMRLPGGRYEIWGISQGYDCEYPLEMHVRPYSKFKLHARLALRKVDGAEGGAEAGAQDAETVEAVETVGSSTLPPPE